MTKATIDPKVYDLYDEYCHTQMTRRDFLTKASALAIVGGSALAMTENADKQSPLQMNIGPIVEYDSPGGTSGKMLLVKPEPLRRKNWNENRCQTLNSE